MSAPAWLAPWRDEWERNPRLRLGLLCIALLVAVWGLLAASDLLAAQVEERDRLAAQVQRLRTVGGDTRWDAVRDDLRVIDAQWRARLWREPTEGRMQAALQDWLRAQLTEAGAAPSALEAAVLPPPAEPRAAVAAAGAASAPPALPEGLRVVRARATVEVSPLRLHELLARLAQAPGLLRVSRLAVANGERRTLELEVEALFVAGESGPAPATAASLPPAAPPTAPTTTPPTAPPQAPRAVPGQPAGQPGAPRMAQPLEPPQPLSAASAPGGRR